MPSNHLILCRLLLLLPSIFPSFRVFSNELALHIRWPKYQSFSFNISPSSEYSGLISFRIDWFDLASPASQLESVNFWQDLKQIRGSCCTLYGLLCTSDVCVVLAGAASRQTHGHRFIIPRIMLASSLLHLAAALWDWSTPTTSPGMCWLHSSLPDGLHEMGFRHHHWCLPASSTVGIELRQYLCLSCNGQRSNKH